MLAIVGMQYRIHISENISIYITFADPRVCELVLQMVLHILNIMNGGGNLPKI